MGGRGAWRYSGNSYDTLATIQRVYRDGTAENPSPIARISGYPDELKKAIMGWVYPRNPQIIERVSHYIVVWEGRSFRVEADGNGGYVETEVKADRSPLVITYTGRRINGGKAYSWKQYLNGVATGHEGVCDPEEREAELA